MRNYSDNSCRENQNTHFISHKYFYETRVFYAIMCKNMVKADRPQMTI